MKTIKYYKVNMNIEDINSEVFDESLIIRSHRHFLSLLIDELYYFFDYSDEEYGENWAFSLANDMDVVKIEIPEHSFTKHKNFDVAVETFFQDLKYTGVNLGGFLGTNSNEKIGFNWKYEEVNGLALLMLTKKEKENSI